MSNVQRFQFQPLRGPRNIRIMSLAPARKLGDPLHCQVLEVCLDANPQYECLSYSCEKPNGVSDIFISNLPSEITRNCEAALRRLRLQDQPRALWVDAICINQDPRANQELTQQLLLMREIYQRAIEVQLWLGEINTATSRGYMLVMGKPKEEPWNQFRNELKETGKGDLTKLSARMTGLVILELIVKPIMMLRTKVPDKKRRSIVGERHPSFQFFSSPVFERMWCVQEVAMGRSVHLMQGSSTVKWDQLVQKVGEGSDQRLASSNVIYEQCSQRFALQESLRNIMRPQPNQKAAPWPSLSSLLDATRRYGSSVPHDKVYSLWGIFSLMGVQLSDPDYTKPVSLVYREITLASFSIDRNLDALYQITSMPNQHGLPSWVPDLSNTKAPPTPKHEAYRATGGSLTNWQLGRNSNELWLSGATVDRIKICCGGPKSLNESSSQQNGPLPSDIETADASQIFKQWLAIANTLDRYPSGQSVADAFGRTLLTNNVALINQKLPQFLKVYDSWSQVLAKSNAEELFLERGVDFMMDDIASLPIDAHQKQEFALQIAASVLVAVIISPVTSRKKTRALHHWLLLSLRKMNFIVTEGGYMGLAPESARIGDDVVLLSGMRMPFLRRHGHSRSASQLVAPVYMEGMMGGELWRPSGPLDHFLFV